ncbi:xylulokinase [Labedella phragmitis]|uniref:Xylulose kinase n=1 Tax=Labedella phragmitis TaxID=2498849 RepID=A0A3S3Z6J1_9MICO|nr:xylulokinase [Labedella phragmitis]RWZ49808.1 xylulokinase [Labedella phragmitis]
MILAHDLGTTGNKATLVDADGQLVDAVTEPYPVGFGPGGKAEQNPEDWWDAVCRASRRLAAVAAERGATIEGVSFSGQMMGAVAVGPDSRALRPAMIWADTRSVAQSASILERIGLEDAYRITGHRINATYTLSKIAWLRDNEPDVFARTTRVLLPKDYIVARLTGVQVTDPSDASGTNAYDQATGTWSAEVLDAADLPLGLLPEIQPSTTIAGLVTADAAVATGLPVGTPVVIGGGDGPMAALGAGIIDRSSGAYAYLGSSSWVSIADERPVHDPLMRSMTFNHVIPGMFVPTATMQAGGASLQWIVDVLSPTGPDRFAELLEQAGRPAAMDGLFFLPHLLGERSPYWNPRARAAFVGLLMHHGRGNMVRAVLEGVAFNLLTGLTAFREAGVEVGSVDTIGGASKSAALLQIFADVWDVTVSARTMRDEATSVGAAVVGGVGIGMFDDFSVAERWGRRDAAIAPDAEQRDGYRIRYEQFLDAYRRLEPWFESVSET